MEFHIKYGGVHQNRYSIVCSFPPAKQLVLSPFGLYYSSNSNAVPIPMNNGWLAKTNKQKTTKNNNYFLAIIMVFLTGFLILNLS